MLIDYDSTWDILYIHTKYNVEFYCEETKDGLIYHDIDTDEIIGYAIHNFRKRVGNGAIMV